MNTSQTYVLEKFCEEQLQQATQAVAQLEEIRNKAIVEIKSTALKVILQLYLSCHWVIVPNYIPEKKEVLEIDSWVKGG